MGPVIPASQELLEGLQSMLAPAKDVRPYLKNN
jgi:hypothetical protein